MLNAMKKHNTYDIYFHFFVISPHLKIVAEVIPHAKQSPVYCQYRARRRPGAAEETAEASAVLIWD